MTYNSRYCQHKQQALRWDTIEDGRKQLRNQCLACGELIGPVHKNSEADQNTRPVDYRLRDSVRQRSHEQFEEARQQRKAAYAAYLQSPEWHAKKALVLKRDNFLCQGCGFRQATVVHHLTYANIFKEFLFELVSLCHPCHERVHSIYDTAMQESKLPEPIQIGPPKERMNF